MRSLRGRPLSCALSGALVVALAVAAGTLIPSYVWCAGSGERHLSCCCPDGGDQVSVRAPCCETRGNVSQDGTQANDPGPRVASSPLAVQVAVLAWPRPDSGVAVVRAIDRRSRAGPPERLHARLSIYLV